MTATLSPRRLLDPEYDGITILRNVTLTEFYSNNKQLSSCKKVDVVPQRQNIFVFINKMYVPVTSAAKIKSVATIIELKTCDII